VREFNDGPEVRPLRDVQPAEHKFYERHARGAMIDGLYANAVLLVEGPTELGALLIAAEADIDALTTAMEELRAELAPWDQHQATLVEYVRRGVGDHDHLAAAVNIPGLINPLEETQQRAAVAAVLRGKNPSFKGSRDHRLMCEALPAAPPTIVKAMELVHSFVDGDVAAIGEHAL
jgi:hypothetical protein